MSTPTDDFDARLDAMLRGAPARDDAAWEAGAKAIEARLAGLSIGEGEPAWLAAPFPETADDAVGGSNQTTEGARMTTTSEPSEAIDTTAAADDLAPLTVQPSSGPRPSERRPSLVDLARASQVGLSPASRPSQTGLAPASRPSLVGSEPGAAKGDDSGLIDLGRLSASAEPPAVTVREPAVDPGSSGVIASPVLVAPAITLFGAPATDVAATPAKRPAPSSAKIGGAIVAVALAAAFAISIGGRKADAPAPTAEAVTAAAPAVVAAAPAEPAAPAAAAKADLPADKPTTAAPAAAKLAAQATAAGGPAAKGAAGATAVAAQTSEGSKDVAKALAAAGASNAGATAVPDGLAGAMKSAVGGSAKGPTESPVEAAVKAAGASAPAAGSIPDSPSQGAVQGAVGAQMPAAKACVKGQTDASRATLSFGSDGAVKSVNVSGPAAGTPAEGCIKRALSRVSVGPFQRPTFSVGVSVRP